MELWLAFHGLLGFEYCKAIASVGGIPILLDLDKNKLSCAILSADYDDGYIAYLNGIEISRSYNLPEPGTFVSFDETTYYDHEASLYNGGLPDNIFLDSLLLNNLYLCKLLHFSPSYLL